jgi:hypothetical protein
LRENPEPDRPALDQFHFQNGQPRPSTAAQLPSFSTI